MKKVLVLGGSGLAGSKFLELNNNTFQIDAPSHSQLDILDANAVAAYLHNSDAEVVINFTGFTNVDKAQEEDGDKSGLAYRLNVEAPGSLAQLCRDTNKHFIHLSTDYVFDGTKDVPYVEEDTRNPLNWYGKTKMWGEEAVEEVGGNWTIARIMMPYTTYYEKKGDFVRAILGKLLQGQEATVVNDQLITPVYANDAVYALQRIIERGPVGVIHIGSTDVTTPFEFFHSAAEVFSFDKALIKPVSYKEIYAGRAPRPQNPRLSVDKFISLFGAGILRTNKEGIELFAQEYKARSLA
jgi:dTDP-4-dehydrorhamnose reductase